ncbi:MAG: SAM-dependent chlorinase/fluorinase [Gammaproteobacteria bacterium]|nr:SAM-dependent chlorinase/fluorinase [Gammaproteobacteria bacterium]NVK87314.1 SAM-dependent chlorinase/fluorinase [Gammaproteobacteria bacterium]
MASTITLLSDFGSQDGYSAAIIGRLLKEAPQAQLIEVSHDITPQDVWQAALALRRYAHQYPDNTLHMVVVDPGVGSQRQALALHCDNKHWLIGPDNGVLSLAASDYKSVTAYAIKPSTPWWNKHSSFDGLALFTPAAVQLSRQEIPLEQLLDPIMQYHQLNYPSAELIGEQLMGQIVGFDRFGNALTNITRADLPSHRELTVYCGHFAFPLAAFYCAAPAHGRVALINSDNQLELAVYQGSAKHEHQLEVGDHVSLSLALTAANNG